MWFLALINNFLNITSDHMSPAKERGASCGYVTHGVWWVLFSLFSL